jgi:alkylation response protein AidB-like acyl-CoA dehydrogenase
MRSFGMHHREGRSGMKTTFSNEPNTRMKVAVWDDPQKGPTVLHFPLSLRATGVTVLDTWRVLGMRGTGSHDIAIDGAFVPDDAVILRRAQGKWHLLFHVISLLAIPLIYSVYFGVAEAARDIALERARSRRDGQDVSYLVGEMENELTTARFAYQDMLEAAATAEPSEQTTNRVMTDRSILARSAIRSVEKAMEAAGGLAFYRDLGLERRFRDVQAARFHPLQEKHSSVMRAGSHSAWISTAETCGTH